MPDTLSELIHQDIRSILLHPKQAGCQFIPCAGRRQLSPDIGLSLSGKVLW